MSDLDRLDREGDLRLGFLLLGHPISTEFEATYQRSNPRPVSPREHEPTAEELEWGENARVAYRAATVAELREATGQDRWETPATFVEEGAALYVGPEADVVTLVLEMTDDLGRILVWYEIFKIVKRVRDFLQVRWQAPALIDATAARAIAAEAIFTQSGERELSFAFDAGVKPIEPPDSTDDPDAYVIGFRGNGQLWIAVVSMYGEIFGIQVLPVPDDLPAWWRR